MIPVDSDLNSIYSTNIIHFYVLYIVTFANSLLKQAAKNNC